VDGGCPRDASRLDAADRKKLVVYPSHNHPELVMHVQDMKRTSPGKNISYYVIDCGNSNFRHRKSSCKCQKVNCAASVCGPWHWLQCQDGAESLLIEAGDI